MKKLMIVGCVSCVLAVSSIAEVAWELGIGANYGGLVGVTVNNKVSDEVELYGGLALVGAVVGARFYATENVRFNLNYGVQGYMIKEGRYEDEIEIFHGINTGIDFIWDNGFSLGLVYHLISNVDDKIDEAISEGYALDEDYTGKVKLSLGYRF